MGQLWNGLKKDDVVCGVRFNPRIFLKMRSDK